ncbi:MAG: WD40 repeat domain-containing protein [Chloroflexota bacterium]|nr:WD40 repeat domain-containing protein [Chloroflexota bacterium]
MAKYNNSIYRVLPIILWIVVSVICIGTPTTNAQAISPNIGGNVEWSPDGTELAVIANNGIFIYDHNNTLLRYTLTPIDNYFAFGGWSPDGTKLLLGNQIFDSQTLDIVAEIPGYPRDWILDSNHVFTITREQIRVINIQNGMLVSEIPVSIQIEEADASPDGSQISTMIAGTLFLFDARNSGVIFQLDEAGIYTWNDIGTQIAYIGSNNTLNILDISTNIIRRSNSGTVVEAGPLTWSQNRIALVSRAQNVFIWDAETFNLISTASLAQNTTGNLDYSSFGGLIAVGQIPQSANQSSSTDGRINLNIGEGIINDLANGAVGIVIPEPTQLGLQAITDACGLQPAADQALTAEISTQDYVGFTAQLEALPETALPPGCRADLLAVASTIAAQGQ